MGTAPVGDGSVGSIAPLEALGDGSIAPLEALYFDILCFLLRGSLFGNYFDCLLCFLCICRKQLG